MEAVKKVLLENIATAKASLQYDLALVNSKINEAESSMKQLPEDQQELIKIKRKYDLSDNIYSTFLQKRSEAAESSGEFVGYSFYRSRQRHWRRTRAPQNLGELRLGTLVSWIVDSVVSLFSGFSSSIISIQTPKTSAN